MYGPIGVYIEKGHVSCREGEKRLADALEGKGTPLQTGESRYQGWVCGGQMGHYFCRKPFPNANEEVVGEACDFSGVSCPARVTADDTA